eukprot:6469017-Amphidinium_carterae.1
MLPFPLCRKWKSDDQPPLHPITQPPVEADLGALSANECMPRITAVVEVYSQQLKIKLGPREFC